MTGLRLTFKNKRSQLFQKLTLLKVKALRFLKCQRAQKLMPHIFEMITLSIANVLIYTKS